MPEKCLMFCGRFLQLTVLISRYTSCLLISRYTSCHVRASSLGFVVCFGLLSLNLEGLFSFHCCVIYCILSAESALSLSLSVDFLNETKPAFNNHVNRPILNDRHVRIAFRPIKVLRCRSTFTRCLMEERLTTQPGLVSLIPHWSLSHSDLDSWRKKMFARLLDQSSLKFCCSGIWVISIWRKQFYLNKFPHFMYTVSTYD